MDILTGIKNFLEIVNENWTLIVVIIGLACGVGLKIKNYLNTTTEEKIETAKAVISETILGLVTDAEADYSEWSKAGAIKRAEVIDKLYAEYPILSKAADQETLTVWIDEQIDNALETLKKILEINPKVLDDDIEYIYEIKNEDDKGNCETDISDAVVEISD